MASRSAPRSPPDADAGDDAATAAGHQAAAIFQHRGGQLRRRGAGAKSAAGARRECRDCRTTERAALDQGPERISEADRCRAVRAGGHAAVRDSGAARYRFRRDLRSPAASRMVDRRRRSSTGRAGRAISIPTSAASTISRLRVARCASISASSLRLSFDDPVDRMIGAHLIALLCPAGRLTAEPAAIADAMAIPLERVEVGACAHDALRSGRAVRARPEGVPGRTARRTQSAGSGDGGAARQSRTAGASRYAAADDDLWRRCRRSRGHDRRDPRARSEAGGELRDVAGAARGARHPDATRPRRGSG